MEAIYPHILAKPQKCLGEVLAARRRAEKISKQQLSLMVGLSRLTIRKIETGVTNPSLDVLLRITQGIGVSLADVLIEVERCMACELDRDQLDAPYVLLDPTA